MERKDSQPPKKALPPEPGSRAAAVRNASPLRGPAPSPKPVRKLRQGKKRRSQVLISKDDAGLALARLQRELGTGNASSSEEEEEEEEEDKADRLDLPQSSATARRSSGDFSRATPSSHIKKFSPRRHHMLGKRASGMITAPVVVDYSTIDLVQIKVFIMGTAIGYDHNKNAAFTCYLVHVSGREGDWTVTRRYNDFKKLNSQLLKKYPAKVLPKFPKKSNVAGKKRLEESFINQRRQDLSEYIKGLIDARFLVDNEHYVRFFKDTSDGATLTFKIGETGEHLPLWEAFKLLGPSITDPLIRAQAHRRLEFLNASEFSMYMLFLVSAIRYENATTMPLLTLLLNKANEDPSLAIQLYWALVVAGLEQEDRYKYALARLCGMVKPELSETFERQHTIITKLADTISALSKSKRDRPAKIERLRQILKGDFGSPLRIIHPPLPMPLRPELSTSGAVVETATLFKSALLPLALQWRVAPAEGRHVEDGIFTSIFKAGDDLRQDELVCSIINVMDQILKRGGFDLQLSPYRVLATSLDEGLIEVVPHCTNIAEVLSNGTIIDHFIKKGTYPQAVFNFIKSAAGYSVITFLLGIGDRHLDNLLLKDDGRMLHVDYGFVLGFDPKPMPPKIRLSPEMVDAMEGKFENFMELAQRAYKALRAQSGVFFSLFSLIAGSSLPQIKSEWETHCFLHTRFRLDLDDQAAEQFLRQIILDSINSTAAELIEKVHGMAQSRRK